MLILRITLGTKSHFSVSQKCSVTQNMPKVRFRPGLCPGPLGELTTLPRPLSRLGRGPYLAPAAPRFHPSPSALGIRFLYISDNCCSSKWRRHGV